MSMLEEVYGFTFAPFRAYVTTYSAYRLGRQGLVGLSNEMAAHEHPLVRNASGWSAAEAALYCPQDKEGQNKQLFSIAQRQWNRADTGFDDALSQATSEKMRANFFADGLRTKVALACLPTMQTVAELKQGLPPTEEQVETRITESREALFDLASFILRQPPDELESIRAVKRGVAREIASYLLLQKGQNPAHIFIPASLRQDHHTWQSLRADWIAMPVVRPRREILVQVTNREVAPRSIGRRFIVQACELHMNAQGGEKSIFATLDTLLQKERGGMGRGDRAGQEINDISARISASFLKFATAP